MYSTPPGVAAAVPPLASGRGWLTLGLSAVIVGAGAAALRPLMILLTPVLRRSIFHMLEDHQDIIFQPALLAAFLLGVAVGVAQAYACRWLEQQPPVWSATTLAGWLAGVVVLLLAFADPALAHILEPGSTGIYLRTPPMLAGLAAGLVAGGLQWLLLRRRLRQAWLWLPASALTYTLAWTLAFTSRTLF